MPRQQLRAISHTLLAATLIGCTETRQDDPSWSEVQDSLGIRVVENSGTDFELSWSREVLGVIEGETAGGEPFSQLSAGLIGAHDNGTIFVMDPVSSVVQAFDVDGTLRNKMGRRGEGPGEFVYPAALTIESSQDHIAIYDVGLGRISVFGVDGALVDTHSVRGTNLSGLAYMGGDLVRSVTHREETPAREELVIPSVGDTVVVFSRDLPPARTVDLSCGIRLPQVPPVFSRTFLSWSVRNGTIAVVDGFEYEVKVFEDGAIAGLYRRAVPLAVADRELAVRDVERRGFLADLGCDAVEFVEAVGVAAHVPIISSIVAAPDQTLWVTRKVDLTRSRIDIIDSAGRYVGTLPVEFPTPVAFLPDSRMISIVTDELGLDRLEISRIHR